MPAKQSIFLKKLMYLLGDYDDYRNDPDVFGPQQPPFARVQRPPANRRSNIPAEKPVSKPVVPKSNNAAANRVAQARINAAGAANQKASPNQPAKGNYCNL